MFSRNASRHDDTFISIDNVLKPVTTSEHNVTYIVAVIGVFLPILTKVVVL